MPRSHSSPAARTSGASGPEGSTAPGRKCHGSDPSSGSVIATSANSTPISAHAPAGEPLAHATARSRARSAAVR